MANVSGNTQLTANLTQQKTAGVITAQTFPANISLSTIYTNGTGAGQVDQLYGAALTLAGAATTINLQNFVDISGATATNAARVRVLMIQNTDTVAGHNIIVGNATTNPWAGFLNAAGTITIPPGGRLIIEDPSTTGATGGGVTGTTSLNLKFDPGANTVPCNIIIGCSSVA
jgi:hypothetical protein